MQPVEHCLTTNSSAPAAQTEDVLILLNRSHPVTMGGLAMLNLLLRQERPRQTSVNITGVFGLADCGRARSDRVITVFAARF